MRKRSLRPRHKVHPAPKKAKKKQSYQHRIQRSLLYLRKRASIQTQLVAFLWVSAAHSSPDHQAWTLLLYIAAEHLPPPRSPPTLDGTGLRLQSAISGVPKQLDQLPPCSSAALPSKVVGSSGATRLWRWPSAQHGGW
ncbi:hypothetical protein CFC21_060031 [Triticum aestivum]|uniref:Uncharacterized protein n=2 Tax=Triticum aestivum TaxID=4565 RepID=A0A9R1GQK1_WHEAT|nr:hypothetical protein CFC21_060031 [Triticum aestivum]